VPVIKEIKLNIQNAYDKIKTFPINYINYQNKLLFAYTQIYKKLPEILYRKVQILDDIELHLKRFFPNFLQKKQSQLDKYHFSSALLKKMIEIKQYKLNEIYKILSYKINNNLNLANSLTEKYFAQLSAIDYHKIVNQGFAVIRNEIGEVVLSKNGIMKDKLLSIELKDGNINVIVNSTD
jgi:exonuclease VII large subunit